MKFYNLIIVITLCILAASGYANEFMVSLEDLSLNSSDIVVGTVESINSFNINNNIKKVYTTVKVRVESPVKGSSQKNGVIDVIFYGGTKNGRTTTVLGSPKYSVGEEVILFLNERMSKEFGHFYTVYSSNQGKFSVIDEYVSRDSDFPLFNRKNGYQIMASNRSTLLKSSLIQEINQLTK